MDEPTTTTIAGHGGTGLAVHTLGEGRPVLLLHGLFSSAQMNWIRFGHARRLAEAGFRAIMPDLRAHGDSDAPHDPRAYPGNVLVQDLMALVKALALDTFDLVGFSLGARTAAASVVAGLRPRRLVLAGMGLESLDNWGERSGFFLGAIDRFDQVKRGDLKWFAVQFMKTMQIDREAVRLLLGAVPEIRRADLSAVAMPTLVLSGEDDRDNGSPQALAGALPDARLVLVPGNHMSSVTNPDLGEAIVRFLSE